MADLGYFDESFDEWRKLLNEGYELVLKLYEGWYDLVSGEEVRSEFLIEWDDSIHDYPVLVYVVADQFVYVEIEDSEYGVFSFGEEGFI